MEWLPGGEGTAILLYCIAVLLPPLSPSMFSCCWGFTLAMLETPEWGEEPDTTSLSLDLSAEGSGLFSPYRSDSFQLAAVEFSGTTAIPGASQSFLVLASLV